MNKQSSTEFLHQCDYGSVSVCNCCDDVQLSFGNILIQLPIQGLINLSLVIQDIRQNNYNFSSCFGENILIRTPQQNMFITVTQEEFEELTELLAQAINMYEVRKLLSNC
jgi:hypothetical protein